MKLDVKLLEQLTNSFGPSGFEDESQRLVHDYGKKFATEILFDRMRSVVFKKTGTSDGPKIMLAGHCDEIGFIITSIEKTGFLQFHQLGGWWDQTLLTQEVVIRPFKEGEKIIGVIAAPPPHVLSAEQRKKVVTKDKMYIDVGCSSKKEVEALGIRIGDPAVPHAIFRTMQRKKKANPKDEESKEEKDATLAVAKAFDNRIGVFIALEVLRRLTEDKIDHPNTVYCVSTTQEEVGLRGARTASRLVMPDIGFALDVDISGDVPGIKGINQKMGYGVCISAMDGSMIPNPRLRKYVIEIAEESQITYQTSLLKAGGTDAGAIHLTGIGAPSLFLGVATRHIHSHHSMLDLEDVENTVQLLLAVIKRLDSETAQSFSQL